MIITNTAQSYPEVARRILTPLPGESKPVAVDADTLTSLADITRAEWPDISDKVLDGFDDYLLGTCQGLVTVAYRIVAHERINGKLWFDVEPAPELVPFIGQPQPLGPWKRGEARGTRRVPTPAAPATSIYDFGTWNRSLIDAAFNVLGEPDFQQGPLTAQLLQQWTEEQARNVPDNVHVSVRSDGTIVVDVPAGQNVLVRPIVSDNQS